MKHVIGVLGSLVKQPSNPFTNLTEQVKKMASVNVLLAMWPQIGHNQGLPGGSIDLGGVFVLLGLTDSKPYDLSLQSMLHLIPIKLDRLLMHPLLDPFANGEDYNSQMGRL